MHSYYELISRNASIQPKETMMKYLVAYYAIKWKARYAIEAGHERNFVSKLLDVAHNKVCNSLRNAITGKQFSHDEYVDKLKATPAKTKRKVTDAMAIIPAPAAAAYLGIAEVRLREVKDEALFGCQYMGRHCFSQDELMLLAMNPGWVKQYGPVASTEEIILPDSSSLDAMIFVDEDFATAYTGLDIHEVLKQVTPTERRYGTYGRHRQIRLSDLEKIRVAKLNGQQH